MLFSGPKRTTSHIHTKMPSAESQSTDSEADAQQRRNDDRAELQKYLKTLPLDKQNHGWDEFWRRGTTPWDHSQPNPALIEALRTRRQLFGSPFTQVDGEKTENRKRVLVPGCGRGYDVLLFSSYGFNAVGLDVSPAAKEAALKLLADPDQEQKYPAQNPQEGRGESRFMTADFFSDNFLAETHGASHPAGPRTFDFIYDYTFFCALPPEYRPRWAKRMSELLAADGRLVCLEFPLGKDPKLGGPPHGMQRATYEQLLAKPGEDVQHDDSGNVRGDRSGDVAADGLAKVEDWEPEAWPFQKGQVMMSVWEHWKA